MAGRRRCLSVNGGRLADKPRVETTRKKEAQKPKSLGCQQQTTGNSHGPNRTIVTRAAGMKGMQANFLKKFTAVYLSIS